MSVALDAAGTHLFDNSSVTSQDYAQITVGNGATSLLVGIGWGAVVSSVTVTWDNGGTNQAMSLIGSVTNGTLMGSLYGLVKPTPGAKTLHVAWTTGATLQIDSVSFTGSDITGGRTTFYGATTNTGTGQVTTVTTPAVAVGDAAVDTVFGGGVITNPTQTNIDGGSGGVDVNEAMSRASGAGLPITFSWSINISVPWGEVACGIRATPRFRRTFSGLGTRVGSRQVSAY